MNSFESEFHKVPKHRLALKLDPEYGGSFHKKEDNDYTVIINNNTIIVIDKNHYFLS